MEYTQFKEIATIWNSRLRYDELKKLSKLLEDAGYFLSDNNGSINILLKTK